MAKSSLCVENLLNWRKIFFYESFKVDEVQCVEKNSPAWSGILVKRWKIFFNKSFRVDEVQYLEKNRVQLGRKTR